jgi:hypothetical protein
MKNKIIATLVALGLVGSASALDINENLEINGFIDTSYTHSDSADQGEAQNLGLDEIELNFLFNVGGVSGAIHIDDYDEKDDVYADDGDIDVEQAHLTYELESGVSFTIGKFGSLLGFEREDPGGLYTYSRAYVDAAYGTKTASARKFNLGDVDSNVAEGVRFAYNSEVFGITASLVNDVDVNIDKDNLDLELALSYTGIENLVLGGGYYFDNQDNDDEIDVLNFHISTQFGNFLLAAEYIELDSTNKDKSVSDDGYMLLADYKVSEKLNIAFRLSSNETQIGADEAGVAKQSTYDDADKITIAPRYQITESLGAVLEYSDIDTGDTDEDLLALELTFTF